MYWITAWMTGKGQRIKLNKYKICVQINVHYRVLTRVLSKVKPVKTSNSNGY